MRWPTLILLPLVFGCGELRSGDSDDPGAPAPTSGTWEVGSHPCDSRTDDLWFDGPQEGLLACGQSTTGQGLWATSDGGLTWSAFSDDPAFEELRVNDVHRGPSGVLYAAGTGGGRGVVSIDDGGVVHDVWTPGKTVDDSFTAGTFRVSSEGFAVVESLTGTGLMTRPNAETPPDAWTPVGTAWATDGGSYQILDLDLHDDAFYAVGSTISQPLLAFLPGEGEGLSLRPRALHDSARGELWSLDVDQGGIVAGGVDQEADVGHVFTFAFPGDPAHDDWNDLDLSTLWPSDATWVHGVCRHGDRVVAVGAFSKRNAGFVLESVDAGETFADVTPAEPAKVPPLWDCWAHPDGSLVITGEGGFVARRAG